MFRAMAIAFLLVVPFDETLHTYSEGMVQVEADGVHPITIRNTDHLGATSAVRLTRDEAVELADLLQQAAAQ